MQQRRGSRKTSWYDLGRSANAFTPIYGDCTDAFVAKLNNAGSAFSMSAMWAAAQATLTGFMAFVALFAFYFYLGRALRQLDPSQAIPARVRRALDTLAEGSAYHRSERLHRAGESRVGVGRAQERRRAPGMRDRDVSLDFTRRR